MVDKVISELPGISSLDATSLFVAEQSGQAVKVSGKQLTDFSNVETNAQVEQAKASAQAAKTAQEAAEAAILKGPIIQNGTWWVYNQTTGAYQDTGIKATGPQGIPGPTASVNGISPDGSGNITLTASNVNAYSKTEADNLLQKKSNASSVYTKSETYTKEETNTLLQNKPDKNTVVNPNLLDNWYFGNPVNQRGQTSYSGTGYGIDRWYNPSYSNQVVSIMTDCIRLKSTGEYGRIIQKIPADITQYIKDKTVTISLLTKNTKPLMTVTRTFNTMNSGVKLNFDFEVYTTVEDDGTSILYLHQIGNNSSTDILAVKLELGSQQTLAHQDENGNWVLNEIPDYGEQLRRCQRYFWRSWTGERNVQKSILGRVFVASTNRITGFSYPVEMRSKPAITIYGITGRDKITDYASDVDYGDVGPMYWDTQRCMALSITSGVLSMDTYVYYFVEANAEFLN